MTDTNINERFMVLFVGEYRQDISPMALKESIADIFNVSIMRIDKLFCGRPVVIKNDLGQKEAITYRDALLELGGVSWIEPMPPFYRKYSDRRKGNRTRRSVRKERSSNEERRGSVKRGRRYKDR